MRWNHLETRRKEKIKVIKEERDIVSLEEKNGHWVAPTGSGFSAGSPSKKLGTSTQMGGMRTSLSGHSSPSKFQGSTMTKVGFGGPVTDSAMIEKEKQALERIKMKQ
jgi:hypothetical protein